MQKNDIQRAIEAIQDMEELIKARKQKVQIADTSKAGWVTVQHPAWRREINLAYPRKSVRESQQLKKQPRKR